MLGRKEYKSFRPKSPGVPGDEGAKSIKKQTCPEPGRGISRLAFGSLEMTLLIVSYKALSLLCILKL
jgi:hypothetical protein